MLSDAFSLILTSLVALFITFVVGISPNVRKLIKLAFSMTTVSLVLWNVSIYIADVVHTHLLLWNNSAFFWPTVAAVSCFVFVSQLHTSLDGDVKSTPPAFRTYALIATSLILQFGAIASDKIFNYVVYDPRRQIYVFDRGPAYPVYIAALVLMLGIMVVRLVKYIRKSNKRSEGRRALKIVIITIVVTVSYSLVTNVLVPVVTGSQRFISLGMFALDIFSFGLAFSIIRYHFLDIRQYAWLAATYTTTTLSGALLYASVVSVVVVYILRVPLSPLAITVLAVTALGLAISFHPLHVTVNRITRKWFFRDYYDTQDVLDEIGSVLVRNVNVKVIQDECKVIIDEAIHPAFIQFLILADHARRESRFLEQLNNVTSESLAIEDLDPHADASLLHALHEHDVALIVRLRTSHEDLGYILFGFRKSGIAYSTADRRFLRLVSDQIAIGLQNALHFEEIQRFNATLQEEVDEATRKLRRQNKRLEELDNIKDDFISMASHQLRTPLTSVKGYISMVLEGDAGKLNSTQAQMLKQAFASSQRMVFLITDLLNVSRLKTGKFVIDIAPTKLDEVISQELEQLHETAQVKNIELAYDKPKAFPELMLDEVKIRQVIMNFVDNAIYYTPAGGHIKVELIDKPSIVEFRVTDDGIGVPKSEQHHLFTKFYRATNARKARPDGTGLGLFMAQKVIVAQGGSIIFSSQENKGSTFGFSFSKARLAVPAKPASTTASKVALKVKEPSAAK